MKKKELNTETAQQALPIKKEALSLDALQGITVAGNDSGPTMQEAKCRMTFTTFCMERTDTL